MNICFFIGKIISKVNFDFILNSKDISVCIFTIQLLNGSIIKVRGYNEIADYCYSTLKQGMNIQLQGYINNRYEIMLDDIEILDK